MKWRALQRVIDGEAVTARLKKPCPDTNLFKLHHYPQSKAPYSLYT